MSGGEDNSWVFDSLICFLNGPVWNAPLQSFIEDKSLIFEPSVKNEAEYKKVYEEFKNLVDLMLGTYMDDIGITPEQFEIACNEGMHEKLPIHFPDNLFEQIWAANDFEIFKRMMVQKNIQLQLQALEMIERKHGKGVKLYESEDVEEQEEEKRKSSPLLEKQVLVEVIQQCEEEEEEEEDSPRSTEDADLLVNGIQEEKEMLQNALQSTASDSNADFNAMFMKPIGTSVDNIELRKRQAYLKSQRDKLIAMKKQVRRKHLDAEIGMGKVAARPKSAKTAEAVLSGEFNTKQEQKQEQVLKIRKALVERLRSEVVEKNQSQ